MHFVADLRYTSENGYFTRIHPLLQYTHEKRQTCQVKERETVQEIAFKCDRRIYWAKE